MNHLINQAVLPIIDEHGISAERLRGLVYIKEMVDRIASKPYLSKDELSRIEKKCGVKPDIMTWGDYFQAEMATLLRDKTDSEFSSAIDTVKFDMISSWLIFEGKGTDFFEWVENAYYEIMVRNNKELCGDDEEIIHLKILMDYYTEMGISNRFTEAEMAWHSSFGEAIAI